jgi:Na+-transporting NADH:ubiquinone oxidoreductase subunit NqrD
MIESIARILQWYLFALAVGSFLFSLRVGLKINDLRFTGVHVYYAYAMIIVLSLVQIVQSIQLLKAPIGPIWWIPAFCKQLSVFVYIAILYCISRCECFDAASEFEYRK